MPGSVGAATRPSGGDAEAGGDAASACAHPLTQDEIASTRVNTVGLVVAHSLAPWLTTPICTIPPTADEFWHEQWAAAVPTTRPRLAVGGIDGADIAGRAERDASRSHHCGPCTIVCAHCSRSTWVFWL